MSLETLIRDGRIQPGRIEEVVQKTKNELNEVIRKTGEDAIFELGISKIDKGRVFERFFRCDEGRDKETGGTGLGLAIVKHIVHYYQGNIVLTSKLDEGTTFKIILPKEE